MELKKFYSYIINTFIVLLVLGIVIFYLPKLRVLHSELPQLKEWIEEDESCVRTLLPEAFNKSLTICFWSNHQEINVWLEDELIYTMNDTEETFSMIKNSQWNRVVVPEKSNGKELRIESTTGNLPVVKEYVYGTGQELNRWIHQRYGIEQLLDAATIGIGLFFILLALSNGKSTSGRYMPLHLGLSMVLMGTFLRTSLKGIPIHCLNVYSQEMFGYLSFYLITLPMLAYARRKIKGRDILKKIIAGMVIAEMLLILVIVGLHGFGICDISKFIWLGVGSWVMMVTFSMVGSVAMHWQKKTSVTLLSLFSSTILFMIVPLEICRYYLWAEQIKEYGIFCRYGFLLYIIIEIFSYSLTIQNLEESKIRTEKENKKLQFQLLSSQIRPHFILNTLGAIRSMIMEDQQKASDLLYDFSKYLRSNIEEKDYTKQIPFREELDYIETYLRLEKTRFRDRLQVEYQIDTSEFRVLPLTIQPFVENAVKHGVFSKKEGGTIFVKAYEHEKEVVVEVCDDGIGFDISKLDEIMDDKKSVGLRSAIYRIESGMKGKCTIKNRQDGVTGTWVKIQLPK